MKERMVLLQFSAILRYKTRLLGRCSIIRKMKQMELANHSASFPEQPGIPSLGLSFQYALLMSKEAPAISRKQNQHPHSSIPRTMNREHHAHFSKCKANTSLDSLRPTHLSGRGPWAQREPVHASRRSWQCSSPCQMSLIPSLTTRQGQPSLKYPHQELPEDTVFKSCASCWVNPGRPVIMFAFSSQAC